MSENNNTFEYTYSAKEQAELKKIREKYTTPTEAEDKMSRLRRLDASVTQSAQAASLVCGIVGALVLGFGMSVCMSDLGKALGLSMSGSLIVGIIIGVIGAIFVSLAYPIYNSVIKKKRKQLAPEILRLTDELMK